MKDILFLFVGVMIGFVAGIAVYYAPLGQFFAEIRALWHLVRHRFERGRVVQVQPGTRLFPLDSSQNELLSFHGEAMKIWHDEGVSWHHTEKGWKRARVLHVFDQSSSSVPQKVLKICHLDLQKETKS